MYAIRSYYAQLVGKLELHVFEDTLEMLDVDIGELAQFV